MRKLTDFGLLLLLLVVGGRAALASSFMLTPPRVELNVGPGSVENVILTVVTDPGDDKFYFRFYVVDFTVDKEGKVTYVEPASLKRSATNWIELEFKEFEMNPNERKKVNLKISVPRAVSGGYYSAIVLESLPIAALAKKQSLVQTLRMVTLVELTVRGGGMIRQRATISDLSIARSKKERSLTVTATVENQGDAHIKAKGQAILKTRHGARIASFDLGAGRGAVLPGGSRNLKAVLDRQLAPGEYVVEAIVNYGLRGKAVAKLPFSISEGALVTTGSVDAPSEVRFTVDPYWVEVTASAGAFRTVPILVRNDDDAPVHVATKIGAVSFDADGRLVFSPDVAGKWSGAEWVEVEPAEFDLKPRESRRAVAKIAVPEGVTGCRFAQVDFEAAVVQDPGALAGRVAPGSAGTTLLLTFPGQLEVSGEIASVSAAPGNDGADFAVVFRNTGNVFLVPKGKVVIRPTSGPDPGGGLKQIVGEVEFEEILGVIMPEGSRRLRAVYPQALAPGSYQAEVTIDYGGKAPATMYKEFTVK